MSYKKIFSIFISVFILTASCKASDLNEKTVLWKISGNGLSKPSYLFGTHHLIPRSFLDQVPQWKDAFASTERVVGELDLSNMSELQAKIMTSGLMPQGVTYESLMSKDDLQTLDTAMKNLFGAGIAQFAQMKPAMLTMVYTLTMYQKFYPSDGTAIDQFFQQEAAKQSRSVMGLETAEDQIKALFESQTLERQAEILICTIKNEQYMKEQVDVLHAAYLAQDLDKMAKLYDEEPNNPCPTTEAEKDAINKNRNTKWLQKLPEVLKEKPSFIAVGCLHLVGKDGLIEGLRKLGYTVEAVN